MLKHLQSHQEYLDNQSKLLSNVAKEALDEYQSVIQMFRHLNFDPAHELLEELYSHTGRPALAQIEILRMYVLAAYLNVSWEKLLNRLSKRAVFRAIVDIDFNDLPTLPSFYELSRRLMPTGEASQIRCKLGKKPRKKLKANEKMPEKKSRTAQLTRIIRKGNFNLKRPDRFLQQLFKLVSLNASYTAGLLSSDIAISGDGTCVYTGASNYGRKTCDCHQIGNYKCTCPRRYSDPLATWGWDSHKERYFYGYTAYFLATYNEELKLDLPLYVRLVEARRHDSVTALIALTEYQQLNPDVSINSFLSDSASDNYETYQLLNEWQIPSVIALNKRTKGNFKYKELEINDKGIPICEGDLPMIFNWSDKQRMRTKWRCPAMTKKCVSCPLEEPCSTSAYGRIFYTKSKDNLRFFPEIPRQSTHWHQLMKQRTAVERINKQTLIDCGIEANGVRTKSRLTLWLTASMMVIHLKAQYKYAD